MVRKSNHVDNMCVSRLFSQAAHVNVVAVGIGDAVEMAELEVMAGRGHAILVKSFEDLKKDLGKIKGLVCH